MIGYTLEQLQNMPHKWWKKDQKYIPCKENLPVEFEGEFVSFTYEQERYREEIYALSHIALISNIIPTRFDCYYAINTELMEYLEANIHTKSYMFPHINIREEAADIAIFCALYLKWYHDYDLTQIQSHGEEFFWLEPVYSWLPNTKLHIIQLLKWAVTIAKDAIPKKINYNGRRPDHVSSGY